MSIPCSISLVRSPPQSPVIHLESALKASSAIALADNTRAAAADIWQISRVLLCCFFIPTSSSLLLLNCFYLTRVTFFNQNKKLSIQAQHSASLKLGHIVRTVLCWQDRKS